nr:immunoglobulin heavy chain junction region [Mus musculus]
CAREDGSIYGWLVYW